MSRAKKPMVKCPGCEERFYREDGPFVHLKNRYWHEECYNNIQAKEDKKQEDMKKLDEYICELFGTTFVSPRIRKQINTFIKNNNFTHSGILGTLKYWFDIKGGSLSKANGGIGIVPYVYEDASKYFSALSKVEASNQGVEEIEYKEKTIRITPPKMKRKSLRVIDLDFLEEES